jgi:pimeloyl-ACP methyl ester carboxylesterase
MALGAGPERALALHCTMAFGGAWSGLARHLGDRLTLVAPDMPSHGRSADWDERSDFSDTVYQASLDAMDEGPMHVIGHSFGAMTALRLAVAHPERVRSLTVIEPVFFAVAHRMRPEVMDDHDARAASFTAAIASGDREGAARVFNRMWSVDAPKWDAIPQRTRDAMARAIHVVPDTQAFLYEDTSELLAPGALDACEIPTLVMRGEAAHPAIVAVNDGLAEIMPNARQAVIPEAGHMAPISHPAEVAAEIGALLDRAVASKVA